jgi:hypothetical protein
MKVQFIPLLLAAMVGTATAATRRRVVKIYTQDEIRAGRVSGTESFIGIHRELEGASMSMSMGLTPAEMSMSMGLAPAEMSMSMGLGPAELSMSMGLAPAEMSMSMGLGPAELSMSMPSSTATESEEVVVVENQAAVPNSAKVRSQASVAMATTIVCVIAGGAIALA